jgi:hypothetical protein
MARTVILLGCVQSKLDEPAPAADLFISPLFRARRAYAEHSRRRWFVLSSRYGLVRPDQEVAPYDLPMARRPVGERRDWAEQVTGQLAAELGSLRRTTFEIHAGSAYVEPLEAELTARGATVSAPLRGLGLGKSLAWYTSAA